MKKYWIEKVEYPNGMEGFSDCVPIGNYENKDEAIKSFNKLVKDKEDENILISLYEHLDEYDIDNLIMQQ